MIRAVMVALSAAALLPVAASAQYGTIQEGSVWGERIRVTPFAGVAPRLTRVESMSLLVDDQLIGGDLEVELAAGPAAGAEVEVRVWDRVSVLGSGFVISRGEGIGLDPATASYVPLPGSNFLVAKLGVAMRLREAISDLQMHRLTATVFAAPAFIRELPKDAAVQPMNLFGANAGLNIEVPLDWHGVAFQLGAEDFLVFWDDAVLASRTDAAFARAGTIVRSTVATKASHMVLLRAGVSIRFR